MPGTTTSFSSPLSYSWSAASTQRPKSPPPPPSSQKRNANTMQTPSILMRSLEIGSPQPQNADVQQLLHYIDNLSFSSEVVNKDHSLYLHEQEKDLAENENSSLCSPKVSARSVLQNRSVNQADSYNVPPDFIVKPHAFPELTPIRRKSSPPRPQLDPIGATPLKAKENLLHEASRYIYTQEEEPNGSSPIRTNEKHLFESSRHYLSDDESSASSLLPDRKIEKTRASSSFFATKATEYLDKNLAPTPSRPRKQSDPRSSPRKSLEPSLEHSMDEAWSIVLGSTIIEQSEAQDQNDHYKHRREAKEDHLYRESSTSVVSPSSKILDNLPDKVKSPEDAKKLLRTAVHTLQDARAERESARLWATEMKGAVHKWVEHQRQLMGTEFNGTESEVWQQTQLRSLSNLEGSIQKLCQEVQSSSKQRTSTEERLHHLLIDQREKIQCMAAEVLSMKQQIQHMEKKVALPRSTSCATPTQKEKSKMTPSSKVKSKLETPSRSMASSAASSRIRKEGKKGGHIIVYGNGVRKEVHKDGTTVIRFTNGDVETKFSGGTIAYFHAKDRVMQINNTADGSMLFEYPNRQIERHYRDGSKAILFADGTRQRISAEGKVDTAFVTA